MVFVFDMQGTLYPKTKELIDKEKELGGYENLNPSDYFLPLSSREIQFLGKLKGQIFIATGGSETWALKALQHLGILHPFDKANILTSFDKKVNSNWLLLSNNTTPKHNKVYFIGDTIEYDMKPAKKLGMDTVWINHENEIFAEVNYECKTLLHALETLNNIQITNTKKMNYTILLICLTSIFFAAWALLQIFYLKRVDLITKDDELQNKLTFYFPIAVSLINSMIVFTFSSFYFVLSPTKSLSLFTTSFQNNKLIYLLLIGSAICLAISYALYPFIVKESLSNAAFITIGITLILLIVFSFFKFDDKANWPDTRLFLKKSCSNNRSINRYIQLDANEA